MLDGAVFPRIPSAAEMTETAGPNRLLIGAVGVRAALSALALARCAAGDPDRRHVLAEHAPPVGKRIAVLAVLFGLPDAIWPSNSRSTAPSGFRPRPARGIIPTHATELLHHPSAQPLVPGMANQGAASLDDLREAIYHGAVQRLRPKIMTVPVILAGLLPILWCDSTGAGVTKHIALALVRGGTTSCVMELLACPATFRLCAGWGVPAHRRVTPGADRREGTP